MKIITLKEHKILASNCYLIITDNAFSVVDPSVSFDEAKKTVPELSCLKPDYVILTHAHIDHFWEIDSYVSAGCTVLVSEKDSRKLGDERLNCAIMLNGNINSYQGEYTVVSDGDRISVAGRTFEVIETPGHTDGSLCYLSDDIMFTGDTLFADGVFGRYDLPSGNPADLMRSLKKLFSLNADIVIYPGHGEISTLKSSKSFLRI